MWLPALPEESCPPAGAVGLAVADLVGGVTDADAGNPRGIAVTGVDVNGTLHYSTDGGANWIAAGAVGPTQSLLLKADGQTRVYFEPAANFNGSVTAALTFRAWDQSTGSAGQKVNTTTNGGATAFSSAVDIVALTVTAVDDAPVSGGGAARPVEAGPAVSRGGAVGAYADVEGSPVTSGRNTALGTDGWLQYRENSGAWADVALNQEISRADIDAGRLRFVSDANESGSPYATIGFRVSDGALFSAAAYTLTVNVAPEPLIAIDAVLEGDNVVNALEDGDVVVSGTTTAVEAGRTVTVTLRDTAGTTITSLATVGADGRWALSGLQMADISGLLNGDITVSAAVSNAAGRSALPAARTLRLEKEGPGAPLIARVSDDVGNLKGLVQPGRPPGDPHRGGPG